MEINFWKYQGNGNDFVIIDSREGSIELSAGQIKKVCDRHFGIGADGLMILLGHPDAGFEMKYYNADGHLSSMCGNGGRCIAAFAFSRGIVGKETNFTAYDGLHKALINSGNRDDRIFDVSLSMGNVEEIIKENNYYLLNTGSPHYVEFVNDVANLDVITEGRKTRYSERFAPDGLNVNFVELGEKRIFVRTYERGVEDETLSCGTGVTASAIAAYFETGKKDYSIHTTGGDFRVSFSDSEGTISSVWLHGQVQRVFQGITDI